MQSSLYCYPEIDPEIRHPLTISFWKRRIPRGAFAPGLLTIRPCSSDDPPLAIICYPAGGPGTRVGHHLALCVLADDDQRPAPDSAAGDDYPDRRLTEAEEVDARHLMPDPAAGEDDPGPCLAEAADADHPARILALVCQSSAAAADTMGARGSVHPSTGQG